MNNILRGLITCGSNCRSKHPFNRERREECEAIQNCACRMGALAAINPNLHLAALQHCNGPRKYTDPDQFLCNEIGGESLYEQYGIQMCGFDPFDSPEAQLSQERQNSLFRLLGIGLSVLGFVGLLLFILRNRA